MLTLNAAVRSPIRARSSREPIVGEKLNFAESAQPATTIVKASNVNSLFIAFLLSHWLRRAISRTEEWRRRQTVERFSEM
jgi:hypothetical protein